MGRPAVGTPARYVGPPRRATPVPIPTAVALTTPPRRTSQRYSYAPRPMPKRRARTGPMVGRAAARSPLLSRTVRRRVSFLADVCGLLLRIRGGEAALRLGGHGAGG